MSLAAAVFWRVGAGTVGGGAQRTRRRGGWCRDSERRQCEEFV